MSLRLGKRTFADDEHVVMAIVNRTPDSFFDGARTFELGAASRAADEAVAAGADIIDVGGVKAGPGVDVDANEERSRVVELVAEIRRRHPAVLISVDTWRAEVARACVDAGADLINDTWGGADPRLAEVVAQAEAGLVCTHAGRSMPRTRPHRVAYTDVVADVVATLTEEVDRLRRLGVRRDGVIVDPGFDLGKNTYHSLAVLRELERVVALGYPVLVCVSRKDFIGEVLDAAPDGRLTGTITATTLCAWLGARIFRAHDVAATVQALRMISTIKGDVAPVVPRRGLA